MPANRHALLPLLDALGPDQDEWHVRMGKIVCISTLTELQLIDHAIMFVNRLLEAKRTRGIPPRRAITSSAMSGDSLGVFHGPKDAMLLRDMMDLTLAYVGQVVGYPAYSVAHAYHLDPTTAVAPSLIYMNRCRDAMSIPMAWTYGWGRDNLARTSAKLPPHPAGFQP